MQPLRFKRTQRKYKTRYRIGNWRVYSDAAIETFRMISMIYGLALRQTEAYIESLFELAGVTLRWKRA